MGVSCSQCVVDPLACGRAYTQNRPSDKQHPDPPRKRPPPPVRSSKSLALHETSAVLGRGPRGLWFILVFGKTGSTDQDPHPYGTLGGRDEGHCSAGADRIGAALKVSQQGRLGVTFLEQEKRPQVVRLTPVMARRGQALTHYRDEQTAFSPLRAKPRKKIDARPFTQELNRQWKDLAQAAAEHEIAWIETITGGQFPRLPMERVAS